MGFKLSDGFIAYFQIASGKQDIVKPELDVPHHIQHRLVFFNLRYSNAQLRNFSPGGEGEPRKKRLIDLDIPRIPVVLPGI